jgi:hypothetical protein
VGRHAALYCPRLLGAQDAVERYGGKHSMNSEQLDRFPGREFFAATGSVWAKSAR